MLGLSMHGIYFNPRTRVECDQLSQIIYPPPYHFNPRTRVECDGYALSAYHELGYFNPRTRVECDIIPLLFKL